MNVLKALYRIMSWLVRVAVHTTAEGAEQPEEVDAHVRRLELEVRHDPELVARGDAEPPAVLPQSFLVVIDPGHGPKTRGKRSPLLPDGRQLVEYEFNHDVGARVAKILRSLGGNVRVTTELWEQRIGPIAMMGNALRFRTEEANSAWRAHRHVWPDGQGAFVSIHANAAPQPMPGMWVPDVRGIETWFYHQSAASRRLAKDVHLGLAASAIEAMNTVDRKLRSRTKKQFWVLKATHMPACLVECGFFTHPEECRLLLEDDVRQTIAQGIANGIVNHIKSLTDES